MILAGDVGGTNVRLALFEYRNGRLQRQAMTIYRSRDFAGLVNVVQRFRVEHPAVITAAVFGVPGPVIDGTAQSTNLPWTVTEQALRAELDRAKVKVVNDLVAMTSAVPHLTADQLRVLHAGEKTEPPHVSVVLAPGTGLGHGYLYNDGRNWHALASEGGHADFAPTDALQAELMLHLAKKFGHVSVERVVSGSGLLNIYNFFKETGKFAESPALRGAMRAGDPGQVIAEHALAGREPICMQTLELFIRLLGQQAGNLVLTLFATGGVYLGGGIPPKITPALVTGGFLRGYLQKGRLSYLVERTPVYIIRDDTIALLGAASIAVRQQKGK